MLYAWELQGGPSIQRVAEDVIRWSPRQIACGEAAEVLATAVARRVDDLDRQIGGAADNWRLDRIGTVERNILRMGLHELQESDTPARVVISEAVRLAHWFAGGGAPGFVNGVLDALARQLGRL
jgi:N utilization substance protein B